MYQNVSLRNYHESYLVNIFLNCKVYVTFVDNLCVIFHRFQTSQNTINIIIIIIIYFHIGFSCHEVLSIFFSSRSKEQPKQRCCDSVVKRQCLIDGNLTGLRPL